MRIFKSAMMVVLMSVVVASLTACGGDDGEDVPGTESGSEMNAGVHRVDVQFSGDTSKCDLTCTFYGMGADGKWVKVYENGKLLTPQYGSMELGIFEIKEFRDISVQTENKCIGFNVTISIFSQEDAVAEDIKVTMVGYIDDKQINTQVFTLPAGKRTMLATFVNQEGVKASEIVN